MLPHVDVSRKYLFCFRRHTPICLFLILTSTTTHLNINLVGILSPVVHVLVLVLGIHKCTIGENGLSIRVLVLLDYVYSRHTQLVYQYWAC